MTKSHYKALLILHEQGPQFNGDLAVQCGVMAGSNVLKCLEYWGMITRGSPYELTDRGRYEVANISANMLERVRQAPRKAPRMHNRSALACPAP